MLARQLADTRLEIGDAAWGEARATPAPACACDAAGPWPGTTSSPAPPASRPPGRARRRGDSRTVRCRGTRPAHRHGATAPRSRGARCGRGGPRPASAHTRVGILVDLVGVGVVQEHHHWSSTAFYDGRRSRRAPGDRAGRRSAEFTRASMEQTARFAASSKIRAAAEGPHRRRGGPRCASYSSTPTRVAQQLHVRLAAGVAIDAAAVDLGLHRRRAKRRRTEHARGTVGPAAAEVGQFAGRLGAGAGRTLSATSG